MKKEGGSANKHIWKLRSIICLVLHEPVYVEHVETFGKAKESGKQHAILKIMESHWKN